MSDAGDVGDAGDPGDVGDVPGGGAAIRGGVLLILVSIGALFVAGASGWTDLLDIPQAWAESDFQILWAAGQGLSEGVDIHDPMVLDEIGRRAGRPVTPFCAANPLVVRAFGLLPAPFFDAYELWLVVSVVLLVVSLALLTRILRDEGAGGAAAALALGVLLLNDGTWMALSYNSTNLVALAAVLGALRAAQTGRPVLEGVLLAVATVAKTSPGLLVVLALFASRRRTVFGALAGGAALLGTSVAWSGWALHLSWIERVLPRLGYAPVLEPGAFDNSLHAWNLAPAGWLARLAHANDARAWVPFGAGIVAGVVVLALVALARRRGVTRGADHSRGDGADPVGTRSRDHGRDHRRDHRRDLTGLYAVGLTATFLISSVTWPHHLVLAALPVAWLILRGWSTSGLLVRGVGAAAVIVLYTPLDVFSEQGSADGGSAWRTAALAVLFVVVFSQAWRGGAPRLPGRR